MSSYKSFTNSFIHNNQTFSVHMTANNNIWDASITLSQYEIVSMKILDNSRDSNNILVSISSQNLRKGLKNFDNKLQSFKKFIKTGFCLIFHKIRQDHSNNLDPNLVIIFILEQNKNKPIIENVFKKIGLEKYSKSNGQIYSITLESLLTFCANQHYIKNKIN